MNSHESKGCQLLFSGGHRFAHKIGTGLVYKSDVIPLGFGHSHIERVYKENPAFCLDCDSRSRACTVIRWGTIICEHFLHWWRGPLRCLDPPLVTDTSKSQLRCRTVKPTSDQPPVVFARICFRREGTCQFLHTPPIY